MILEKLWRIIRKLIRNKEIKSDILKDMKRQRICILGLKVEEE